MFWIDTNYMKMPQDVIDEVNAFPLLLSHIQDWAQDTLTDLYDELDASPGRARRKKVQKIIHAIESDYDCGWEDWVTLEGTPALDHFKREIDNWLSQAVDHRQSEWFPSGYGSQARPNRFTKTWTTASWMRCKCSSWKTNTRAAPTTPPSFVKASVRPTPRPRLWDYRLGFRG